jgi:hypothetical protein
MSHNAGSLRRWISRPVDHLHVDLEPSGLQVFRHHQRHAIVEVVLLAGENLDWRSVVFAARDQRGRLLGVTLAVVLRPGGRVERRVLGVMTGFRRGNFGSPKPAPIMSALLRAASTA